ncbi:MAG: hypothetical protein K9W44_16300 [Candidatus Lokiarchaeota archaeon]|nr:hypothetical protein [Candidatus Harpocratesius repetitus]
MLKIKQLHDEIQISCEKCNDRFEFMQGNIVHWKGGIGDFIISFYLDQRRGWH